MSGHIIQREENDCGIASMAMLVGLPYEDMAREAMLYKASLGAAFDGCSDEDFKGILSRLGLKTKIWYAGPKNRHALIRRLERRTALLVVPAMATPLVDLHAVYWQGESLLDPSPRYQYPKDGLHAMAVFKRAILLA